MQYFQADVPFLLTLLHDIAPAFPIPAGVANSKLFSPAWPMDARATANSTNARPAPLSPNVCAAGSNAIALPIATQPEANWSSRRNADLSASLRVLPASRLQHGLLLVASRSNIK